MTSETDNKVEAAVEHLRRTVEGGSHLMPEDQVNVPIGVLRALLSSKEAADQRCDRLAAEVERLKLLLADACGDATSEHRRAEAAEAKLSALVEACQPFVNWAADNVEPDLQGDQFGIWSGNRCEGDRIKDWFGPSDFYRLAQAIASLDRTAPESAEPAQEVAGLVEKVARIIDADAFRSVDEHLELARSQSRRFSLSGAGNGEIALANLRGLKPRRDAALKTANAILAALSSSPSQGGETFQARVQPWMLACFNPEIAADKLERNDRFIEEALELVQASAYPKERAHALVEYVYGRPQGDINQEVGGVMVTLAAHCLAHGVDMHEAGEAELARINQPDIIVKIRAKQAAKPKGSALPIAESAQPQQGAADDTHKALVEALREAEATFEDIRVRLIGNLDEPERTAFWRAADGRTKVAQALVAFQSRKEESR